LVPAGHHLRLFRSQTGSGKVLRALTSVSLVGVPLGHSARIPAHQRTPTKHLHVAVAHAADQARGGAYVEGQRLGLQVAFQRREGEPPLVVWRKAVYLHIMDGAKV